MREFLYWTGAGAVVVVGVLGLWGLAYLHMRWVRSAVYKDLQRLGVVDHRWSTGEGGWVRGEAFRALTNSLSNLTHVVDRQEAAVEALADEVLPKDKRKGKGK